MRAAPRPLAFGETLMATLRTCRSRIPGLPALVAVPARPAYVAQAAGLLRGRPLSPGSSPESPLRRSGVRAALAVLKPAAGLVIHGPGTVLRAARIGPVYPIGAALFYYDQRMRRGEPDFEGTRRAAGANLAEFAAPESAAAAAVPSGKPA